MPTIIVTISDHIHKSPQRAEDWLRNAIIKTYGYEMYGLVHFDSVETDTTLTSNLHDKPSASGDKK